MKKRVYKATNVKKINLEKLKQEVEGKYIVLGVDVAKRTLWQQSWTKIEK